jgi:hypothetical protein
MKCTSVAGYEMHGDIAAQRSLNGETLPPLSSDDLERLLDAEAASDSTYQGTYSRAGIYRDPD